MKNYDRKTEKLIKKARPFIKVWNDICKNKSQIKDCGYAFITIGLGEEFCDIFKYLRNGSADFIYIDGIGKDVRAEGLLCMEEDRTLADPDNCFFIGDIENINNCKKVNNTLLTAWHLNEILGEEALFLICKVITEEREQIINKNINSFLIALEKKAEELHEQ